MLSIIVSTVYPERLERFRRNVAETIGDILYEIIAIENVKNPRSLANVYNEGGSRARFPYLLFMHEDAGFITRNWFEDIRRKLDEPDCGTVGFAGSKLMFNMPGGWGMGLKWMYVNVLQCGEVARANYDANTPFVEVVTIDGLAMFVRKEVWAENPFDEESLPGFHCYDVDFSLNLSLKYRNYVCFCVDVYHDSAGNFDRVWLDQTLKIYEKKWKHILPRAVDNIHLTPSQIKYEEERQCFRFLKILEKDSVLRNFYKRRFMNYPLTLRHFEHLVKLVLGLAQKRR